MPWSEPSGQEGLLASEDLPGYDRQGLGVVGHIASVPAAPVDGPQGHGDRVAVVAGEDVLAPVLGR
jgi:hypothetical protein